MGPKRAPPCRWLAEHIEKMLDSIKEDKAGLGQGRNLTKTQFQDAATAINEAFKDTQNKDKSLANVSDKWRTLRSVYIGLLAWDKKSGVSYDNEEFGCGVTPETQTMWNALLAEHKNVAPYSNKPWPFFTKMRAICDSSVAAKGEKVFAPHNTPGPLAPSQPLTVEKELDAPDVESTSHPKKLEPEVDLEPGATEVTYSSDEDVVISDKPPRTPGLIMAKRQPSEDEIPSASQAKRSRGGRDALTSASRGLEHFAKVFETGIHALVPPTPSTPSRTGRGMPSGVESSPVRAQNAIAQASTLELEHLKKPELVMKFICFLEENEKAVITYNTLVKMGKAELRESYVKECIRKYEAAEGRKELGL